MSVPDLILVKTNITKIISRRQLLGKSFGKQLRPWFDSSAAAAWSLPMSEKISLNILHFRRMCQIISILEVEHHVTGHNNTSAIFDWG